MNEHTIGVSRRAHRLVRVAAVGAATLVGVVLIGCTSNDRPTAADSASAVAEDETSTHSTYANHNDAALAAAVKQDPGLQNPAVTAAIVIFSNETAIDLRAQVRADNGYCQWFGVNATVQDTAIQWRSGPANGCSGE